MIAGRQRRNAAADPLDDTGALVSEHGRRVARRVGSGSGVELGVADAARDEPNEHLAGARFREVHLLHGEWSAELLEHRRAILHYVPHQKLAAITTYSPIKIAPSSQVLSPS